ncbi:hypothetical protein O6H91_12G067300 [Diphasiastrum complanatum]|uniref:Uncharacterized protein n=1 Tax=Diphasiastrum complanatum TaxID=34168 RepID=A0ACC2C2U9_DIPCM|nr:hypothetical protein O6H91_12G067300 [Diphasiastrum complanatum]
MRQKFSLFSIQLESSIGTSNHTDQDAIVIMDLDHDTSLNPHWDASPSPVAQKPPSTTTQVSDTVHVLDLINSLPINSKLQKLVNGVKNILIVDELPGRYDGDVIYELPNISEKHSSMEGMEQTKDGHPWVRYVTTTISSLLVMFESHIVEALSHARTNCATIYNLLEMQTEPNGRED